jgi:hypothetical protein
MPTTYFRCVLVGCLAVSLTGSWPAVAADAPLPDAETLFVEGKGLMSAGRFGEACPKFEASQRKEPAPGTLIALGYCRERLGQLASARDAYVTVLDLAGNSAEEEPRVELARSRAAALEARISTLTLVIPEGVSKLDGFELRLNSLEVDRSSWGAAVPLDQGVYTVEVTAPGRQRWSTTIALRDEGDRRVVVIPPLDDVPADAPRLASPTPPPSNSAPSAATRDEGVSAPPRALTVVTWGLAIGSALSIGAGTAFALRAKSENDQSNSKEHCNATGCDDEGLESREEALSSARVATGLFIAGGALGGAALTVYLLTPSEPKKPASSIVVGYSGGAVGAALRGSF